MIKANKYLLLSSFLLAMGCGQQSSGDSQEQAQSQSPAPNTATPQTQQLAALDKTDVTAPAAAASERAYVEGEHYERLDTPVTTVDSSKIEVAEVFWYGCGHCYHFEPLISQWKSQVADDVVVVKSPAMWDKQGVMANHARIYYTAKALGVLDVINKAAFRALNEENNPLRTEESIARLFTDNGVAREDFERTFSSFGVTSAVRQAEARQRGYRVQGTPEIVVDGTYRISTRMAGSQQGMLDVADFLIEKIREQKPDQ